MAPTDDARLTRSELALGAAALAAAAVVLYGMTFGAPVFFDDASYLLGSAFLKRPAAEFLPALAGRHYFALTAERTWQPLVTLFHWAVGARPWAWRLAGALLHALNAGLAGLAARRLGASKRGAAAAAALFLVFPLSTETVFFSSFKGHLLAAASALAGWLCWARADETGSARWRDISRAVFALGLLGKETAAVGLGLVALHELVLRRRGLAESARRLVPHAAILGAYLVWRFLVLVPPPPTLDAAPWMPVSSLGWFLGRLLYPGAPCLLADPPGRIQILFVAASAALAGILRRSPRGLFLLGWAVAALLPAALLAGYSSHTAVADRHLYLASAALAAGLGVLVADSGARALAAAALLLWWGGTTLRRNGGFRDLQSFARQTAACGEANPAAHAFLGLAQLDAGDFTDAAASFYGAEKLAPGHPGYLHDLGIARAYQGDLKGAAEAMSRAYARQPSPDIADDYGLVLAMSGRDAEAVPYFEEAIRQAPWFEKPYRHAAKSLEKTDPARADWYLTRARSLAAGR